MSTLRLLNTILRLKVIKITYIGFKSYDEDLHLCQIMVQKAVTEILKILSSWGYSVLVLQKGLDVLLMIYTVILALLDCLWVASVHIKVKFFLNSHLL